MTYFVVVEDDAGRLATVVVESTNREAARQRVAYMLDRYSARILWPPPQDRSGTS